MPPMPKGLLPTKIIIGLRNMIITSHLVIKQKSKFCKETTMAKQNFSAEEAKEIGEQLGIDWSEFDVDQFKRGLDVELEHGLVNPETNVTNDDPIMTGKIALAHLNEYADYYDRLERLEKEAEMSING
jgi:hypothetical protein